MALLAAVVPLWPYEYYIALRIVVFCAGAWLAWSLWQDGRQGLAFALGLATLIFNPFVPAHLTREIWTVLNLIAAGVFGAVVYVKRDV